MGAACCAGAEVGVTVTTYPHPELAAGRQHELPTRGPPPCGTSPMWRYDRRMMSMSSTETARRAQWRRHQLRHAVVGGLRRARQPAGPDQRPADRRVCQSRRVRHGPGVQPPRLSLRCFTTSPRGTMRAPEVPPDSQPCRVTTSAQVGARPRARTLLAALALPEPLRISPAWNGDRYHGAGGRPL